jgi:hypothetical protein
VIYYYLEVTQFKSILKQANDTPFMADRLGRYGYLPNPKSEEPGLPVGFSVAQENSHKIIGMTYTACHIRQIDVSDTAYRIDGGPAISATPTSSQSLHVPYSVEVVGLFLFFSLSWSSFP